MTQYGNLWTRFLDQSQDILVHLDPDLKVAEAGKRFTAITGLKSGDDFQDGLDPFTASGMEKAFTQFSSNSECVTAEMTMHHRQEDGKSVQVTYSWTALKDQDKKVLGYIGWGRAGGVEGAGESAGELQQKVTRLEADLERRGAEIMRLKNNLESQSHVDDLTGLGNRRNIIDRLSTEIPRAVRYDQPLTVMLLDIDHLEDVNETYGHERGDEVIRNVSEIIQSQIRLSDYAARFEGEQFMVLCPHTDRASSQFLGERLRRRIAETSFHHEDEEFGVTVSMGLVTVRAGNQMDTEAILQAVTVALQSAKNGGLNRLQLMEAP